MHHSFAETVANCDKNDERQPANHISTLRGCLPISVEAVVINFRDVAAQHSSQIARHNRIKYN